MRKASEKLKRRKRLKIFLLGRVILVRGGDKEECGKIWGCKGGRGLEILAGRRIWRKLREGVKDFRQRAGIFGNRVVYIKKKTIVEATVFSWGWLFKKLRDGRASQEEAMAASRFILSTGGGRPPHRKAW